MTGIISIEEDKESREGEEEEKKGKEGEKAGELDWVPVLFSLSLLFFFRSSLEPAGERIQKRRQGTRKKQHSPAEKILHAVESGVTKPVS